MSVSFGCTLIVAAAADLAPIQKPLVAAFPECIVRYTFGSSGMLAQQIRHSFAQDDQGAPTLSIQSFGFARGLPRNADLVFDMRFLRNPHWDPQLRPDTGLDAEVALRDHRLDAELDDHPAVGGVGRPDAVAQLLSPHAPSSPLLCSLDSSACPFPPRSQ